MCNSQSPLHPAIKDIPEGWEQVLSSEWQIRHIESGITVHKYTMGPVHAFTAEGEYVEGLERGYPSTEAAIAAVENLVNADVNANLNPKMIADFLTSSHYKRTIVYGSLADGAKDFLMEQYGMLPNNPDLDVLSVGLANSARHTTGVMVFLFRADDFYRKLLLNAAMIHDQETREDPDDEY